MSDIKESSFLRNFTNDVKRAFQWLLGCTYAKKSIVTRMKEKFQFAEAPHVVIMETYEARSWTATAGIIVGTLICVLITYYIAESIVRSVRKFLKNAMKEPQGTITTPTCLSPTTSQEKISNPHSPIAGMENGLRPRSPKIHMNEPVNCVFIRPTLSSSSTLSVPTLDSTAKVLLKNAETTAPQLLQIEPHPSAPDRAPTPPIQSPGKVELMPIQSPLLLSPLDTNHTGEESSAKKEEPSGNSSDNGLKKRQESGADVMECFDLKKFDFGSDGLIGWLQQQILETDSEDSTASLSAMSDEHSYQIEKLTEVASDEEKEEEEDYSRTENVSEMSPVTMSVLSPDPSKNEELSNLMKLDSDDGNWARSTSVSDSIVTNLVSKVEHFARENINQTDDIDIVINDNYLFADYKDRSFGYVSLKEGQSKVVFRYTDDEENTIDTVTITGSFFGWKMNLPMRRCSIDRRIFSICVELPPGMHEYRIQVYRFDL